MAKHEIRRFGDPVLRQKCKKIPTIDPAVQTLIDDMIETMRDAHGVGLAAPQVGVPLQLTVIEVEGHEPYVFINPEIIKRGDKRIVTEGCLSLPGWFGEVERSESVTVRARDRRGKEFRLRAEELLGQAIEHEVDHLNGVLFTDRLTPDNRLWKSDRDDEQAGEPAA